MKLESTEMLNAIDKNVIYLVQSIEYIRATQLLNTALLQVMIKGGKLAEIGGYVYGRTGNGDPFIILYPAKDHLIHKICRVYKEKFHLLPNSIIQEVPGEAQEGNPDKNEARRQNIYHDCPVFIIATIDGKDTNMGPEVRFYMTVDHNPIISSNKAVLDLLAEHEKQLNETSAEIDDTPDEISADELNAMLGLNKEPEPEVHHTKRERPWDEKEKEELPFTPDEEPDMALLVEPYRYGDKELLADNKIVQTTYKAFFDVHRKIPASGQELKNWWAENKEFLKTTYNI